MPIVNTRRYADLDGAVTSKHSKPFAFIARLMNDFASTVTLGAICATLHDTKRCALLRSDNTATAATATLFSGCTLFATGAGTIVTAFNTLNAYIFFTAKSCFFKGDGKTNSDTLTLSRSIAALSSTAAATAENRAKDVAKVEIHTTETAETASERTATTPAVAGVNTCMTKLVIP